VQFAESENFRASALNSPTWPWNCEPRLLVFEAAWKRSGLATDSTRDCQLKATEMLAMVADEALQIHGGMGLMADLPLERSGAMRASIESGTAPAIQRHIISRSLLRPLGG
jgi:alkylation response protein AidB-like acyl-CoA dehydrogenase